MMINAVLLALSTIVAANVVPTEEHNIQFNNRCGFGNPTVVVGGKIVGGNFIATGPIRNAIAFPWHRTGNCGFNGENCTVVETTLQNPTTPGTGSETDITLIPPHTFSVPVAFNYTNGCNGVGRSCPTANCVQAFHEPGDPPVQAACQANNVALAITFC
ncbi:hypothetical protein BD410DRAFT_792840 [Rickenella mellea]|uniref:Glycopeptide n=1 Tax=Rickenella mellea TaxID=50990 RepID=A0A4Y7PTW1_9AGAM|nr:hypothetical protein BD410DRAFT_792840 [Rickenella mellea]